VILEVTQEVLNFLGYEVLFAQEGAAAIEIFSRERSAGRPFDLVILDLSVPEGMGGQETFKKLHALDPSAKIIVSSGYTSEPMMTDPKKFGLAGALAKPYRIAEIKTLLETIIPTKV
jgi:CheY-like chemotaxis protein